MEKTAKDMQKVRESYAQRTKSQGNMGGQRPRKIGKFPFPPSS